MKFGGIIIMAERPVCEACGGTGQIREGTSGPFSVCAACQGAGRITVVGALPKKGKKK